MTATVLYLIVPVVLFFVALVIYCYAPSVPIIIYLGILLVVGVISHKLNNFFNAIFRFCQKEASRLAEKMRDK